MYQLRLNGVLIDSGPFKSMSALFDDLSGLSFAKGTKANWLDKMSVSESYQCYLQIKASEFDIAAWHGVLSLIDGHGETERVHLFDTHAQALSQVKQRSSASTAPKPLRKRSK